MAQFFYLLPRRGFKRRRRRQCNNGDSVQTRHTGTYQSFQELMEIKKKVMKKGRRSKKTDKKKK
jgi:hypothetical protein